MFLARFPPEPNGYLHVGHLKAMLFNFEHPNSKCILRLDDTNPDAEKQEYVDAIINDVKWLGFNYESITYTSDYFDKLIDFAEKLIQNNYAYVDFSSSEDIKNMRHNGESSVYRSYNVDYHMKEWNNMKSGCYPEGHCVLRLKIDMSNVNHSLRDPIAYRIKYNEHYRTKTKYCVYPSYDYSHGIVDALEHITHSFCTMEFYERRDQYYWPINKLIELNLTNLKPALVQEFGRFNIEGIELSKRKIIPLVENGTLDGFDDPRLYTIRGLRKRGFTPEILKKIVRHTTNSMSRTPSTVSLGLVDYELRTFYDQHATRAFAVVNPLKLILSSNINANANTNPITICCAHPNNPKNPSCGQHSTTLTDEIWIEASDFKLEDDPSYYRLTPNKTKYVRLKYADYIKFDSFDSVNNTIHVNYTENFENVKKPKGIIHWVNSSSPKAIFKTYESIYDGKTEPKIIVNHGYVEDYVIDDIKHNILENKKENCVYQFERLGYYKFDHFDEDSVAVFIKIIELVDTYNKINN